MSACLMVSAFDAKPMVNLRSQIAHWQCTKRPKLPDGRPLLGAQRTGRRLLRRLGHELPPTILDKGRWRSRSTSCHDIGQGRLTDFERVAAEIVAVQFDQVEGVQESEGQDRLNQRLDYFKHQITPRQSGAEK
jgi:hypothetical protein